MQLDLIIEGAGSAARTADRIRELEQLLRPARDLKVALATQPAAPGSRGGELGPAAQLALTFLTSGAAVALVECLRAFIQRDRQLSLRIRRPSGAELVLDAKNLSPDDLAPLAQQVERMLGEP